MDPRANLDEQRELAAEIVTLVDSGLGPRAVVEHKAARLAELVQAQDDWRRNGGYDPYTDD